MCNSYGPDIEHDEHIDARLFVSRILSAAGSKNAQIKQKQPNERQTIRWSPMAIACEPQLWEMVNKNK